jgi:hypothetical protein
MTVEPSRTILDFTYEDDIRPIVKEWAEEFHFKVSPAENGGLRCRRSGSVMLCGVMLEVQQSGSRVHLETWLDVDILTEFATLFNAPKESAIQSGETLLWREKEFARRYVNPLLERLNQPLLK